MKKYVRCRIGRQIKINYIVHHQFYIAKTTGVGILYGMNTIHVIVMRNAKVWREIADLTEISDPRGYKNKCGHGQYYVQTID